MERRLAAGVLRIPARRRFTVLYRTSPFFWHFRGPVNWITREPPARDQRNCYYVISMNDCRMTFDTDWFQNCFIHYEFPDDVQSHLSVNADTA